MSEKANLRKFIEAWFSKKFPNNEAAADFDHATLLGRKCMLNVTHTEKGEKTYANIANAAPLPKGMTVSHTQHNASLFFDLSAGNQTEVFNRLPEWLQKKINERIEDQPKNGKADPESEYLGGAGGGPDPNDDIPFAPIGGLV